MHNGFRTKLLLFLALLGGEASAQNLFLLPGSGSSNTSVDVFSTQLTSLGAFGAGSGSFLVVAKPSGTEFYVVATGASQVSAVDASFDTVTPVATLGSAATAAAISANGDRLLVLAETLHIFDISTNSIFGSSSNTDLTGTGGLAVPTGTEVDFAISLDGTRGYLLAQGPSVSTLYEVDLTSSTPTLSGARSISIPGAAAAVAVAPSGLIYATTSSLINEINPGSFQLTTKGSIAVVGNPGKPLFTPNGHYLVAPNNQAGTGPWVEVDLTTDTPVDTTATGFTGVTPNALFPTGNTTAFGYSAQSQTLYSLTLAPPVTIAMTTIPTVSQPGLTAVAVSPEVAGGSVTGPHYLFFVVNSIFYRMDLTTNQLSGQVTLPQAVDAISDAGAISTASPATLLVFGNNQQLAPNDVTLPLVVRVLDSNGLPLDGVTVSFSTANAGVVIANSSVTTGVGGYASTTAVTAASSSGVNTITAAVGGLAPVTFNITVGTGSPGNPGGPGQGQNGGLQIVAGQGIVAYEDLAVGSGYGPPLTVEVTNASGGPAAGVNVTFQNSSPLVGSLPGGNANGTLVTPTNSSGIAMSEYLTNTIETGLGHAQGSLTATAPGAGSVTFYVTVIPHNTSNGGASNVDFSGTPLPGTVIKGSAGETYPTPLTIKIYDGQGLPIPNVSMRMVSPGENPSGVSDATLDPDSTAATCLTAAGLLPLTDTTGSATCNLRLLQQTFGENVAIATDVGYYLEHSFFVNIGPGMPAKVNVSPTSASGNPGQGVSAVVTVTDGAGNPISNVPVSYQIQSPNTISLTFSSAVTNSAGQATLTGTLGGSAGTYQIQISAGGVSAVYSYTVIIPVTSLTPLSGGNQTAVINTAFSAPLVVVVNTANGVAAGVPVTFAASNGATLSNAIVATDSTGKASTMVTAGSAAGPITVTATVPNGQSTSFSLTVIQVAPPVIAVSSTSVTLSLVAGSTTQGVVPVTITNSGGGALNWTASSNAPWLLPTPPAGLAPSTLNIDGSAAFLTAGPYSGIVTISAAGATPVNITVSLTVTEAISITSIVNGASFLPATAQNGWITITGTGLSKTTRPWQSSDFVDGHLPVSLDGVSVTINGVAAYVYYISPTQLNVLAPPFSFQDGTNSATLPVIVQSPVGTADSTVLTQTVAPGTFLIGTTNYAAAIHTDGSLVAPVGKIPGATSRPAQVAETISVYLSGLGTNTNPAVPVGVIPTEPSVLLDRVAASVGGVQANVTYAALVSPGLYQINMVIPQVASGDQRFAFQVDSVFTQEGVLLSIE